MRLVVDNWTDKPVANGVEQVLGRQTGGRCEDKRCIRVPFTGRLLSE